MWGLEGRVQDGAWVEEIRASNKPKAECQFSSYYVSAQNSEKSKNHDHFCCKWQKFTEN